MTSLFGKVTLLALLVAAGSAAQAADYGNYKGKGGMTKYKIETNVYEYHYDKGFTGADAMGWDPAVQFAWSRIGAAATCGVAVDREKVITGLIAKHQHDRLTHGMIGIDFHAMQSKNNPKFCTPERVEELKQLMPAFEAGEFAAK